MVFVLIVLLILSILYCYNISGSNKYYTYFWNFGIFKVRELKKRLSLKVISLLIIIKRWHHKCHYYLVIIKNKLKVIRNSLKKIIFGKKAFFPEFSINYNKYKLIKTKNTKLYSYLWSFINKACSNYNLKNRRSSVSENTEIIAQFYETYKIVSFKEFKSEDGEFIFSSYENFLKNSQKIKKLSFDIWDISKKLDYPSFVLDVIYLYSLMLEFANDEYRDCMNEEEKISLMNVPLEIFFFNSQQIEIFINALELELKRSLSLKLLINDICLPFIEILIYKLKFINFLKKKKEKIENSIFFKYVIVIMMPIFIFHVFSFIFKLLPFQLIFMFFFIFIFKIFIKILKPFFLKKRYFSGFKFLFQKIFEYFWKNKFYFLGLYFFGACFSMLKAYFQSTKNGILILINYMLKKNSNFFSFVEIATSFNINSFLFKNPSSPHSNFLKNEKFKFLFEKNLNGGLIFRAWNRNTIIFRKIYNKTIEMALRK